MNNLFDTANYPDQVPAELVAGTVFSWKRSDITSAYPTADYTLRFRLVSLEAPYAEETITAAKTDGAHVVIESATGAYADGEYRWFANVTRDSDGATVKVDEGLLTVRPASGQDNGHVYRTLMAIRATIEGTASQEQVRIEIGGRVLENRSPSELMALEREYSKRWMREKSEINRKAGRPSKGRVLVGMRA